MKRKRLYSCFSVFVAILILIFSAAGSYAAENNYELYIAQGMEKINDRQYSEALELLQKALEMAPEDTEAIYYTAIVYTRLGELDKAEELFLKIVNIGTVPNVNFELGRIYYVKSECDKSGDYLKKFISASDDESLIEYSNNLIKDCSVTDEASEEEKYRFNITTGIQHDDNVTVEPKNPIVPEDSRKSDGMVLAYLDAGAELFNKGSIKLKVDYSLYHNFHFDLNDYDVLYHKLTPSIEIELTDTVGSTVGYAYEHTVFGGERYSRVNTFFTNINIKEGKDLSTEVIYEYRDLDYDDTDLFASNSIRTGHQNLVGVMQNFKIKEVIANVYYYNDNTSADVDYWASRGYRLGAGFIYQVTEPLYVTVSGQYSEDRYRDDFPGFTEERRDKTQQYSIVLTYSLTDKITIYLTDDYTSNDSNLNTFEYDRNVIGLLLTIALL